MRVRVRVCVYACARVCVCVRVFVYYMHIHVRRLGSIRRTVRTETGMRMGRREGARAER